MREVLGSQDPVLWYVNRSTGLVLSVLLSLTVALGVAAGRRAPGADGRVAGVPRFVSQAVHRGLGLLSVLLLAVHIASAVLDEYVDVRWWQAVVPADLHYRPLPLALGVVACDVVLAAVLSSLVRTRLRHRHWRAVHLTTYLAWGVALGHGLLIGTDTGARPVVLTFAGSGAVVAAAVVHRVVAGRRTGGTPDTDAPRPSVRVGQASR